MTGSIYLIRNTINGKGYVGQTNSFVQKRFSAHKLEARNNSTCALHRAMRKYGFENFVIQTVVMCERLLLDDLESHYIKFYGTFAPSGHGYNMTTGGDSAPRMERTKEHSAKLSASKKGIKLSKEHRSKISVSLMGSKRKPLSDEIKARISAGRTGQKCSNEHKAKMSENRKGNSFRKGIPHSAEVKARISASMKLVRAKQQGGS